MIEGCSKLTTIPQLDTANGTNFGQMFRSCSSLVTIPQLDTSKGTSFGFMFDGCSSLVTTGLLDVSKSTDFSSTFSNCSKLTNTKVMGIKANISFANSPLLTQESIEYLIDNAQTVTGKTITLHATALARVTAEYKQKATDKGWTVK